MRHPLVFNCHGILAIISQVSVSFIYSDKIRQLRLAEVIINVPRNWKFIFVI